MKSIQNILGLEPINLVIKNGRLKLVRSK